MALTGLRPPIDLRGARRNMGDVSRSVAANPWIARLARFGHVVRGIIYFVPGALAVKLALGQHAQTTTQAGAIDLISRQPIGRYLLIPVAAGLAGYAIWGVIRAVLDPLQRGHTPVGIAQRFGYATSAIAYAALLAATVAFLTGTAAHVAPARDWSIGLLARPFGAWIVGLVGACWIFGSGLPQIVQGWRADFARDLSLERVGAGERRWAMRLGRAALVARGLVFTIIGLLLVAAALHRNPRGEGGLDGALLTLTHHSFGRLLLGAAGAGLMAFGVYSAMCARWMRTGKAGSATPTSTSHVPTS
jgi:uncharacterized protein DUF1206